MPGDDFYRLDAGRNAADRCCPTGNRVLLKRVEPEAAGLPGWTEHEGGLVLPPGREKNPECVVVAVGPGGWIDPDKRGIGRKPMRFGPGDHVMIGRWDGHEVRFDGVPHLIIDADAVLAVLDFGAEGDNGFASEVPLEGAS